MKKYILTLILALASLGLYALGIVAGMVGGYLYLM